MIYPSTIEESIEEARSLPLTHDKLFFKSAYQESDKYNLIIINFHSLVRKYIEEIRKNYLTLVELDEKEMLVYKYHPKKFCDDVYGTPEIWGALLLVNNMVSQLEFTSSKIYVFKKSILDFLDEVLVLEEDNMNWNTQYIENKKKNNK